jgi:hypothetical protein
MNNLNNKTEVNEHFNKIKGEINMNSLIENCINVDSKRVKLLKGIIWLYVILIIFYSCLMIINPDPDIKTLDRISGSTFIFAFTIFLIVFYREFTALKNTDYTLPLSELLNKAEKRYKIWNPSIILIGIAILLIDVGVSIIFLTHLRYMPDWNFEYNVALIQIVFFAVIFISWIIGYYDWLKRYKPLLDNIKVLKKDLLID